MSFFRKLTNFTEKREDLIKETIINTLKDNKNEIQFEFKDKNKDFFELSESTNSLCATIEAIFLHGLKDSFLWQTMNILSDNIDHRPEPNFWPVLLLFMHSNTIEQLESLSQITSEIGFCRSWVRLSLNESLLSSYLSNIRKNSSALKPYYKKNAFLKDSDQVEVAEKIIQGIEACVQINLPINSSLLNNWPNEPLQLSGIWTPPLKSCPVTSGEDVASSLRSDVNIPKPLRSSDCFLESISSSPFGNFGTFKDFKSQGDLNEAAAASDLSDTENLHIFLNKIDQINENDEDVKNVSDNIENLIVSNENNFKEDENILKVDEKQNEKPIIEQLKRSSLHGNSISEMHSWSDEPSNLLGNETKLKLKNSETQSNFSRSNSLTNSINSLRSPIDFNTLLIYAKNKSKQQIDLENDVWNIFETSLGDLNDEEIENNDSFEEPSLDEDMKFEVVPRNVSEKFTKLELHDMVAYSCRLARETGLHSQGFVCKGCAYPLGIGFANAKACSFSGNYFCDQCISPTQFLIPAKIIYNYDFRRFTVSKRAADFLEEFQNQPFIQLKLLNPDIYQASDEMEHLQSLRMRLNFIRAYLYTCCDSSIDQLQKLLQSKNYLFDHIHKYSIADLNMIHSGQLAQLLEKSVKFGEEHVLNCNLCRIKGFICEICSSPKVLFPFHLDTTYVCQLCGAVFHDFCFKKYLIESEPCPKCERKRKREDLPLLEAIQHL